MTISTETIAALAPDQASLNAANKLMSPGKWPLRAMDADRGLVWGECQGSGANPYRVVFDLGDHGSKCTCPSRKFPCKHVLALMWMFAGEAAKFAPAPPPDWVTDWLGRRRKPAEGAKREPASSGGKSLAAAAADLGAEAAPDPEAEARARAAAERRAAETEAALHAALADLETWLDDQLRTGLGGLLGDLSRCRAIAARMVDGKAQALAGRLDELPAEIMALSGEDRLDALIVHLGKLVVLSRAFRADPANPAVRRAIATSETREDLLATPEALRLGARWQVAGERIRTRRDGLVSQASYLMNLTPTEGAPAFALLLDFFPASVGRRNSAFAVGEQFEAELVFYPGASPLRAIIAERRPLDGQGAWPQAGAEPLLPAARHLAGAPWDIAVPILLPEGRIVLSERGKPWWRSADGALSLPLATAPPEVVLGLRLARSAALWDGMRLSLLSSDSDWGLVAHDA